MSANTVSIFCLKAIIFLLSFFQKYLLVPAEKTSHLTLISVGSKTHNLPSNMIKAQIFMSKAHVPTEHNNAFRKEQTSKGLPTISLF